MFGSKRILALDIGSHHLTLGEFRLLAGANVELVNYALHPLGAEPGGNAERADAITAGIRDMLAQARIKPGSLLISISGQIVFPRYVKLPPVASDRVLQIIQYEAEQNVPFPINEVVWDHQRIEGLGDDLNVMLVAVKSEIVKGLTDSVEAAGLEPDIVDVAPLAIYNTVCHNYADTGECLVVLDIGARSTDLIFVERPRVFTRSIPVAGNAITQELVKEFGISFQAAEELKREQGLVGLGGVAATGDEVTDQVSKTIRSVMTRLHADVNRTINFYRGQQGGSAPTRLLLTGGSSQIPEMDTFFAEKLNVEVEFLNPFRNVPVAPTIDAEAIARDVNTLSEVVGLALRRARPCPIEINLMPRDIVARKTFRKRVPFFAAAAVAMLLSMALWWLHFGRLSRSADAQRLTVQREIERIAADEALLNEARKQSSLAHDKARLLVDLIDRRAAWIETIREIRSMLLEGMWLTEISPQTDEAGREITGVNIRGYGFEDRLRQYESDQANPIEFFRNRLRESKLFAPDKTEVEEQGMVEGDFARVFRIKIVLNHPIRVD